MSNFTLYTQSPAQKRLSGNPTVTQISDTASVVSQTAHLTSGEDNTVYQTAHLTSDEDDTVYQTAHQLSATDSIVYQTDLQTVQ